MAINIFHISSLGHLCKNKALKFGGLNFTFSTFFSLDGERVRKIPQAEHEFGA